jgi:hypothetical protein
LIKFDMESVFVLDKQYKRFYNICAFLDSSIGRASGC